VVEESSYRCIPGGCGGPRCSTYRALLRPMASGTDMSEGCLRDESTESAEVDRIICSRPTASSPHRLTIVLVLIALPESVMVDRSALEYESPIPSWGRWVTPQAHHLGGLGIQT